MMRLEMIPRCPDCGHPEHRHDCPAAIWTGPNAEVPTKCRCERRRDQ